MNVTERHLRYFTNEEFVREGRNWLPMYNPRLLLLLDVFRHLTGTVILSPHPLALGRMSYPKNPTSKHIYDVEDGVRAIDIFPTLDCEVFEWVYRAEKIGFTGIGVYSQWTYNDKQRTGIHLDVRKDPYQWGYVDGEFITMNEALELV